MKRVLLLCQIVLFTCLSFPAEIHASSAFNMEDIPCGVLYQNDEAPSFLNTGVVAYVRDGYELWIMAADGSQSRKMWEVPMHLRGVQGISLLKWNRDGTLLGFVSDHDALCGLNASNIYVIEADGSNMRMITNRPGCLELEGTPTGTVTVDVRNTYGADRGVQVSIEGAPEPVFVNIGPGQTQRVTLLNVPDIGSGFDQYVVVVHGNSRWFLPASADVIAGQTVHAGILDIGPGNLFTGYYVRDFTWSPDGNTIAYSMNGYMQRVPVDAPPLTRGTQLMSGDAQELEVYGLEWSPVNNDLVYYYLNIAGNDLYTIAKTQVGSSQTGDFIGTSAAPRSMRWTPDGGGFIMTSMEFELLQMDPFKSNIFHIDLANQFIHQVTPYTSEFAIWSTLSPDGHEVIYSYSPDWNIGNVTLRRISLSGGSPVSFGPNEAGVSYSYPAWGSGDYAPSGTGKGSTPSRQGQMQAFPNPSNGSFVVELELSQPGNYALKGYDIAGKLTYVNPLGQLSPQTRKIAVDLCPNSASCFLVLELNGRPLNSLQIVIP